MPKISDRDFDSIREYLSVTAGIELSSAKKMLVTSRLWRRLRHYKFNCFSQYVALLSDGAHAAERQIMLDLLTTNETYFFRESDHFTFLKEKIAASYRSSEPFRLWSAASSTGEEAYSAAMVLADELGKRPWEIIGTDINQSVLEKARSGHYIINRIDGIPREYLRCYCLEGTGPQAGTMLIEETIRKRVTFRPANLNNTLPDIGLFNVIFLRNVLIYFNEESRREIVRRVLTKLKSGGFLFLGHSETLHGITDKAERVAPTTYLMRERRA